MSDECSAFSSSALAALLCVAVCVLWVRSYGYGHYVNGHWVSYTQPN